MTYVQHDYSITSLTREDSESIATINELSILVNSTDEIVGLSGYLPHTEWKTSQLEIPSSERRILKLTDDIFSSTGIPRTMNTARWPIYRDRDTRILRIGESNASYSVAFEVIENVHFYLDSAATRRLVGIVVTNLVVTRDD